jgi:dTDP-D-glucose 4,6-dehydratase
MEIIKIDKYHVMYSSNRFSPRIWLKEGNKWIGQLIFRPNGTALPPDYTSGNTVNLYYHLDDFQNAIDMLRNESPMYLLYSGSGGGNENGIKTIDEIVGEGEEI